MKIEQSEYNANGFQGEINLGESAQWVLVFGDGELLNNNDIINKIKEIYPKAYIMGCSTAGEIHNDNTVRQKSICITAVQFEKSTIEFKSLPLSSSSSFEIGDTLTSGINKQNLKHLFILSEGVNINGSKLVEGMRKNIEKEIPITGGLSGDGSRFKETFIINNNYASPNQIVLAAIYGDVKTSCASFGGWDMFGIERFVTKSKNNILYEIDEKPALDIYKEYLGDKADELPASGLLFPLSVRVTATNATFVRTLLGVNEEEKSLIFAGDIPINSYCRLMKANTNNLVNAASKAAESGKNSMESEKIDLAILISCVGRRLVLKKQVDSEIEAVREVIGDNAIITGFYSYGEIAPHIKNTDCELHNQTMTLTFLSEE